jgi:hypothetical protein
MIRRLVAACCMLVTTLVLPVYAQEDEQSGAQAWRRLQAVFEAGDSVSDAVRARSVQARAIDGCRARVVLSESSPSGSREFWYDIDLARVSPPRVLPVAKVVTKAQEIILYVVAIASSSGKEDIRTGEGGRQGGTGDGNPVWKAEVSIPLGSKAWVDSAAAILTSGIRACRGTPGQPAPEKRQDR